MNDIKKMTCFVITPIGDSDSGIRRHIDGIIEQAIIPALADRFIVEAAHKKYEIGSINDRIIRDVYESDLVIANLTGTNPNVMYELAVRYSFGKPAIVIAERGTKLPFDVIDENTIFYVNDPTGAKELKDDIIQYERNIDYQNNNYGPVRKIIDMIPIYKNLESGKDISNAELLKYLKNRLDNLELKASYGAESKDSMGIYSLYIEDTASSNPKFICISIENMLTQNNIQIIAQELIHNPTNAEENSNASFYVITFEMKKSLKEFILAKIDVIMKMEGVEYGKYIVYGPLHDSYK